MKRDDALRRTARRKRMHGIRGVGVLLCREFLRPRWLLPAQTTFLLFLPFALFSSLKIFARTTNDQSRLEFSSEIFKREKEKEDGTRELLLVV